MHRKAITPQGDARIARQFALRFVVEFIIGASKIQTLIIAEYKPDFVGGAHGRGWKKYDQKRYGQRRGDDIAQISAVVVTPNELKSSLHILVLQISECE